MKRFLSNQRQTWQSLAKKPSLVITVVTTMGITLGALLCILTLAYLLLFKPLPYPEQDKLFIAEHSLINKVGQASGKAFTYPGLIHLFEKQTVFSSAALLYYGEDVLTSHPAQPTMLVNFATPQWFDLTAPVMALGRTFGASEAIDSNNPVAILTWHSWQKDFAGDPDILNQKVDFSGVSYRIVGVLGQSYVEPELLDTGLKASIWLPWDFNQGLHRKDRWGQIDYGLMFVGKLAEGITPSQAAQTIKPLVNDIWQEKVSGSDYFSGWSIGMSLVSFQSAILGDSKRTVYLLMAGVLGLVLIACANIANLLMSRTAEQQHSLAIRAAVGAKKSDLFKALFAESAQLMLLSIILALLVAAGGFYILQHYLVEMLPRAAELSVNGLTFTLAVVCVGLFAFVFARLSSRMIDYRALNHTLQSSGKGTGVQVSKKARQLLIASQVAVATALIFININLFKHAMEIIEAPMGFTLDNLQSLNLSYAGPGQTPEASIAAMDQIQSTLESLPQVAAMSRSSSPLHAFGTWALTDKISSEKYTPNAKRVGADYFKMIEQPMMAGEAFTAADVRDKRLVMVINDVFAKQLAPTGSALGIKLSPGGDSQFTVVGIVKSIHVPGSQETRPRIYVPQSLESTGLLIQLKANQTLSREQVVTQIKQVNSLYTVYQMETFAENRSTRLFAQTITAITTAVLALLSLFLAAIGLYGILSYSTQMRQTELGTRMAIGAKSKDLLMLIVRDNSAAVLSGVAVSIVALLTLYVGYSQGLSAYIGFGLLPLFLLTLVFIGVVALMACYLPLRPYLTKPPIVLLRGNE